MTQHDNDKQSLTEENIEKEQRPLRFQSMSRTYIDEKEVNEVPGFCIKYPEHKKEGLQSAADMWIDRDRLFEGVSKKGLGPEDLKSILNK